MFATKYKYFCEKVNVWLIKFCEIVDSLNDKEEKVQLCVQSVIKLKYSYYR